MTQHVQEEKYPVPSDARIASKGTFGRGAPARLSRRLPPILSIAIVLGVWETIVRTGLISTPGFPPMTAAAAELLAMIPTIEFWSAVWATLRGWALGLGIAMVLGIPVGIVLGSNRYLFRLTRIPIEFLRPIPSVALVPLAILIYGTGLESKIFLAAFASFWPILIQVLYGVRDVDPVALDTARAYGLGPIQRLWHITLPSATPYTATGVRIASAVALILAVTAELVIGSPGLGKEINLARTSAAYPEAYALVVVTGVIGWILNLLATQAERRALHWHPSQREKQS